ncbi:MAG TPA: response regulator [Thermoanaerobaculia bacterium]|nr:response regulator [Thermoanaerobaculia bacterium]
MGVDFPRVLIADPDSGLRQQLFSALLSGEVFADCVTTTTDAIAKLEEQKYAVVVLDVSLPFGDVERVIARVATMPAATRPVVLILAANPEAARSLDVEIVQIVLRKPVHLQQLVEMVRSCIRNVRGRADVTSCDPNPDQLLG